MNDHDTIDIQYACEKKIPVSDETLIHWVQCVLPPDHHATALTLRFVELDEITSLNYLYRKQNKATNVLSFPSELPPEIMLEHPFLGDIIICPAVLEQESYALNKPLLAHWAHIVIHGVLHLLGHDHMKKRETTRMQSLEIKALAELGFDNPYAIEDDSVE